MMVDENAKTGRFPRVIALSVFEVARSTFCK
ncbi:hypothetical protein BN439_1903 [Erwinia amylovora Ea644]|nr:hypothetical protein BN439_1903 [Erwinia amylovora Ea644]